MKQRKKWNGSSLAMGAAQILTGMAAVCLPGMRFCRGIWALRVLLQMAAVMGFGMGLMNGLPLKDVHNDGANALLLGRDPAAVRSLWVQLSVNARQAAETFRTRFEARYASYPYPAEAESERELMERAARQ